MTLQVVDDFTYKMPIILMIVVGPLFRRYRYNRAGVLAIITVVALSVMLFTIT